ncbi:Dyp-type peroxidase [Suttonella ornithocola]|uniref:Probable deferrochelatase/peroxidase YfeX n=1 Tax=Suttonella ornithocola TaxID=279832 RepID=A0A380MX85_9GAMM|nr:Dyp-type peroxidase [Suttonella ornithocola]SUO97210.1 Probable deferrochelatase/peroxidase YfeX [Suttonella ornithocola]
MSINTQRVLDNPNHNTIFMVWNFHQNRSSEILSVFRKLCALVINLNNSSQTRFPNACASIVLGIGYEAWQALQLPAPLPKEFSPFKPIKGNKYTAVSTRGDLHIHIRSNSQSHCIDIAANISECLYPVADSIEEIHGFRYWDGRSILGFVDGTENPQGEARAEFGLIGDEDPQYKGGSYLFVQKYIHDMRAWRALPIPEQEKVIGRSKADDIEMDEETKPSNAHIALTNIGDDKKVIRDNVPFGSISDNEMGTYFIAYARYFSTLEHMLEHMFIGEPEGNYDRILDFSEAKTGTLFFVPSQDMLESFIDEE